MFPLHARLGYTTFDCAELYQTTKDVGTAFGNHASKRDKLFIVTKLKVRKLEVDNAWLLHLHHLSKERIC